MKFSVLKVQDWLCFEASKRKCRPKWTMHSLVVTLRLKINRTVSTQFWLILHIAHYNLTISTLGCFGWVTKSPYNGLLWNDGNIFLLEKMLASSGNRTRAARVAGEHSTTEPTMLLLWYCGMVIVIYQCFCQWCNSHILYSTHFTFILKVCVDRESNPEQQLGRLLC